MTMKKFEGSRKDRAIDKREAKKRGIPEKRWEGSKADEQIDKAAVKKANRKGKRR